jgi:hypothetical protein
MANNIEKINLEKVDTPPISEEVQIAQKLEEMFKADPSLRERLNDTKEFEIEKEKVRKELRKKTKEEFNNQE